MPLAMARRHLLMPVVMTLVVAASAAFASTAGASGLRIADPANGRFLTGTPVHVKVEAPRSAGSLKVTLNGKGVTGRLRRVRPGLWQGTLARPQVRVGSDQLDATARVKGRDAHTRSFFTVGKRNRKLLTVLGPPRGARQLVARVRVDGKPEKLTARLNGKRLRRPPGIATGSREILRLGADDGLHYGVNHLRVMAIRGGVYDLERRKIVVPRNRPLVGAGPDRRVVAGSTIRLNGSSSQAAPEGSSNLEYSWKIVQKPTGSKAVLLGAQSVRPTLTTDLPGTYQVALTVTEPGSSSPPMTDVFTAPASPNVQPIGEPIETIAYNGGNTQETADTGIKVGNTTYWMGMPKGNSIQAVIINRTTLTEEWHGSFTGTAEDAKDMENEINYYGEKAIVVISNPDFEENLVSSAFIPIVKSLGVSTQALESIKLGRDGWSVIGVPGVKGSAYFGEGSNYRIQGAGDIRGDLTGYLEESLSPTGTGTFGFVPAERSEFDTSATGAAPLRNTITVGSKEYASQPLASCGTGGFQVEVVLAETLAPVSGGTFTTNGCGSSADGTELGKLSSLLAGLNLAGEQEEGTKLVFLQSIGSPYDSGTQTGWAAVGAQVGRLGGIGQVFADARSSYALVGGLGISRLPLTEASQTLSGAPARLTGMLEPNREDSFVPMLSSPTGAYPYALSTIAYQAPQPWPDSETAEDKAALEYAWELLKLEKPEGENACSVPSETEKWLYLRAEYCNTRYETEWSAKALTLLGASPPANAKFSAATWKAVTTELSTEFNNAQSVWTVIGHLQGAFGATGLSADINLEQIGLEIEKDMRLPAKSEVAGWWLELAANILSIVSYHSFGVPDEVVQKTTGGLSGGLFIAAQLILGPQGAPEAEEFNVVTKEFAGKLAKQYLDASEGLGFIGELLVTDYGKLTAISESGVLGITPKKISKMEQELGPGSKGWSYEQLIPAAYEAVRLEPDSPDNSPLPQNANSYKCTEVEGVAEESYEPFNATALAQLRSEVPGEALGVLVLKGSTLPGGGLKVKPRSPKKELLEHIFKYPKEVKEALGMPVPWFWRQAFEYPSSKNRSVKCEG